MLVTRPEAAGRRFVLACEAARGAPVPAILSPLVALVPEAVALEGEPAGLVLTSEAGAARAGELGLGGRPAWCVGLRTAARARALGMEVRVVAPDAEALLALLLASRPPGLLHLRGEPARGDLAARLREAGLDARDAVAYRQVALPPTPEARVALGGAAPLLVPLFSPHAAALVAALPDRRAPLHVVALSPAVARAAATLPPASVAVAETPDGPAMVAATMAALRGLGLPPGAPRRLPGRGGALA